MNEFRYPSVDRGDWYMYFFFIVARDAISQSHPFITPHVRRVIRDVQLRYERGTVYKT